MKSNFLKNIIPFVLLTGILFTGCIKEEEPIVPKIIPEANGVNRFVWTGLHDYYLWNKEVDGLSNTKYLKKDSLNEFLNHYTNPQDLFKALLYQRGKVDKWSFLVDNSKDIDDWISGISETMGYDFMLSRIGQSNDLFGFVRYVYKGSPAEKAGMKRGDIFLKVNDLQLTVDNYSELLFSTISYKLSFATITDNIVLPNDRAVNMTAVEMQENPIHLDTVFTINNQKVGYLVYNGFNADFDLQLNDVMQEFKSENISQMELDLRYNGGGSVQSSIYLASMLYGTDQSKLFAMAQYNEGVSAFLEEEYGADALKDNFVTAIAKTDEHAGMPINTLNLRKIYILVSDNTASASELLINGLRPYMDVKVIGINTSGKYTGSITLKDEDDNGKPLSSWAMQPIVVKYANSQGVSDYVNGLTPDIVAEEDIARLMPFGDPNETLLKIALDDMQGIVITAQTLKSAKMGLRKVTDSKELKRFGKEMYINPEKFSNLKKEAE
ncbi:MAG TPA: S41 family peptidase [Prolixibacteraceae bacterium]|nr:S41 family peptidase [Prolixibacteraceae bacterium]